MSKSYNPIPSQTVIGKIPGPGGEVLRQITWLKLVAGDTYVIHWFTPKSDGSYLETPDFRGEFVAPATEMKQETPPLYLGAFPQLYRVITTP